LKPEIIKLEEELRLAMLHSDVKKLDELIADSLIFISPDGNIVTKSMDIQAHSTKAQKMSELSPSEQVIQVHDSCVIVSVKMELVGTYNDFSISGTYRYLRVWSKLSDGWRVVAGSVVPLSV